MSELLPCPLCQAGAVLETHHRKREVVIKCTGCTCAIVSKWLRLTPEQLAEAMTKKWNARPPTAADGVTDAQVDAALIAHWGPDALSPRLCSKGDRAAMRAALAAAMGVR